MLIHHATLVLPDRLIEGGWLLIEDGVILDFGEEATYPGSGVYTIDGGAGFLLPGLIDLHCDAIERLVEPRPNVHFDIHIALQEADYRLAGSGITCEFHAVSLNDDEFGVRTDELVYNLAQIVRKDCEERLIRHKIHARLELSSARGSEIILQLIEQRACDLVSLMDHSPGQGQYPSEKVFREYIAFTTNRNEQLPFSPRRYTNEAAIALARRLAHLAPGDDNWKLLFAPGAAEAMSMALKLARRVTGRYKTISLWGSFHGATMGTIAVSGELLFRQGLGPLLPGALHVPPYLPRHCVFHCGERCSLSCARYIDTVFEQEGEIGAVIVETIRNTDVVAPPLEYYRELREICDRHGALLILDETAIALGRTGRMFAIEHYGIQPDMIVLGKGLGGGIFPLAVLLARDELNVAGDTAIGHFTHEKSSVGTAAALAALETLEDEGLIERAARLEEPFAAMLHAYTSRFSCVGPMRHLGMLFALDIVQPDQPDVPWNAGAEAILYEALARGLSFKVSSGSVLTFSPPLIIEPAQWEDACRILAASIEVVLNA